jgi:hypothetical protein
MTLKKKLVSIIYEGKGEWRGKRGVREREQGKRWEKGTYLESIK